MKKMWQDFVKFIMTGNLIMLAIAFILGGATKAVIDSFVADIVNPIIGVIVGKPEFNNTIEIGDGVLKVGSFITSVINLVIIGLVLFMLVKAYERFQKKAEPEGPSPEVQLLTEIRDSLASRG
jgi:large conductance mechanosensitive channel